MYYSAAFPAGLELIFCMFARDRDAARQLDFSMNPVWRFNALCRSKWSAQMCILTFTIEVESLFRLLFLIGRLKRAGLGRAM